MARFSEDFVTDPDDHSWDIERYAGIYPDEFVREIFHIMKLKEEDFELLGVSMKNAANNYEISKKYVDLKQKPFNEERAALRKLAKKCADLREAYQEALGTGTAMFSLILKCEGFDVLSNKHPRAIAMVNQMFEPGTHHINALPGLLTILEEMALHAAPILDEGYNKTKVSHRYEGWIRNLSEVFSKSSFLMTPGKYDKELKEYSSPTMAILLKIMAPLDSKVTDVQLAEGIKKFRQQSKRERQK